MARTLNYCQAINEALRQAMEKDPSVILMGEGVDDPRAVFGSTQGLKEQFGKERVFDIPLSENGMTGVLVGAALTGLKPIMTHQRIDFILYAMDQIVNHAAKRSYSSGGKQQVPMTIRAVVGRGWGQGSQHSQSLQAWFAHVPGLKVIMPTTPYDAKGLLLAGIQDPNPVICIEYRKLYEDAGEVPEEPYQIPIGQGIVRQEGTDVTLVAFSYMGIEAARALPTLKKMGISVELIDPRSVKPLDQELILASVRKTGRLVVADTGWTCCGISAEVAALVAEREFNSLKASVQRVALPDIPTPTSHVLESVFYPGGKQMIEAVCRAMGIDPGREEVPLSLRESDAQRPAKTFVGPF